MPLWLHQVATLDDEVRSKMLAAVTCSELCAPRSGYWKLERGPELEMPGIFSFPILSLYTSVACLQIRALPFLHGHGIGASRPPLLGFSML